MMKVVFAVSCLVGLASARLNSVTRAVVHPANALRTLTRNHILELAWVQDFSASLIDDLPILRAQIPTAFSDIQEAIPDSRFGMVGFTDKPLEPFGSNSSMDYCFRVKYPLTASVANIQKSLESSVVHSGRDWPESQLHALLGTVLSPDMRWSTYLDAKDGRKISKVVVVATDAGFHLDGDSNLPANNADGDEDCLGEDYPSLDQINRALDGTGVIPIFLTTKEVAPVYRQLVKNLGNRGSVAIIPQNSDGLENALVKSLMAVLGESADCAHHADCCYGEGCCQDSSCDGEAEVVIKIYHKPKHLQLLVEN